MTRHRHATLNSLFIHSSGFPFSLWNEAYVRFWVVFVWYLVMVISFSRIEGCTWSILFLMNVVCPPYSNSTGSGSLLIWFGWVQNGSISRTDTARTMCSEVKELEFFGFFACDGRVGSGTLAFYKDWFLGHVILINPYQAWFLYHGTTGLIRFLLFSAVACCVSGSDVFGSFVKFSSRWKKHQQLEFRNNSKDMSGKDGCL